MNNAFFIIVFIESSSIQSLKKEMEFLLELEDELNNDKSCFITDRKLIVPLLITVFG